MLLSLSIWIPIIGGLAVLTTGRDKNANLTRWLALVAPDLRIDSGWHGYSLWMKPYRPLAIYLNPKNWMDIGIFAVHATNR